MPHELRSPARPGATIIGPDEVGRLPDTNAADPWYADGLQFTCSQCGNCCTGGPGFVWLTKDEITKIADHLKITPGEMVERYCRKVDGKFSLIESVNNGQHDCVFLVDMPQPRGAGDKVVQTKRGCRIYPVRPFNAARGRSGRRTCRTPRRGTTPRRSVTA
jgi:hypothetical protein